MVKLFHKESDCRAFPGDTYIDDLRVAADMGKPWAKRLLIAVILGFLADLYFLHDTVDIAFDNASGGLMSVLSLVVAIGLVLLYLYLGFVFGKKLRDYKVFKAGSSLASAIIALSILLIALIALTLFRLSAELQVGVMAVLRSFFPYLTDAQYFIPVSKVFVMTLIMALSAFISALYAYYTGDAVSEAVYRESVTALPSDRALYNKVFFEHSNNLEHERKYEEQERELDRRAVESAFRLGSLASQLNGMVDPADAHEFLEAQRAIAADCFDGGVR